MTEDQMEQFDDTPYDVQEVLAGAWAPGPYGAEDDRGTFNEVTSEKTASALSMLDLRRPVRTYNLSETLFNGFPAFGDREYAQSLVVNGFDAGPEYGGIRQANEPIGPFLMSSMEERVSFTYNMGTKINGLQHVGVGGLFYNGLWGADIAAAWGTTRLGMEKQGPIVTRGVVVDVVGEKAASGQTDAYVVLANGKPCLREGYRITIDDIEQALAREQVRESIGPGDVVLIRTGWREYIELDPSTYLAGSVPGLAVSAVRYLGVKKPAIVGIDIWFFRARFDEDPDGMGGILAHQEFALRYGVRVGEAVPSHPLTDDGVYEFVFIFNPNNARGAVSASAPPLGLANA
jgi:Putative cyclase